MAALPAEMPVEEDDDVIALPPHMTLAAALVQHASVAQVHAQGELVVVCDAVDWGRPLSVAPLPPSPLPLLVAGVGEVEGVADMSTLGDTATVCVAVEVAAEAGAGLADSDEDSASDVLADGDAAASVAEGDDDGGGGGD